MLTPRPAVIHGSLRPYDHFVRKVASPPAVRGSKVQSPRSKVQGRSQGRRKIPALPQPGTRRPRHPVGRRPQRRSKSKVTSPKNGEVTLNGSSVSVSARQESPARFARNVIVESGQGNDGKLKGRWGKEHRGRQRPAVDTVQGHGF